MLLLVLVFVCLLLALPAAIPNWSGPPWYPAYFFLWLAVALLALRVLHPSIA